MLESIKQIHHEVQDVRVIGGCSLWLIILLGLFVEQHVVFASKMILGRLAVWKQYTQDSEYRGQMSVTVYSGPGLVKLPALRLLVVPQGWGSISPLRTLVTIYNLLFIACLL